MLINESYNANLKKKSTWERILYMVMIVVIDGMVRTLMWTVILLQVLTTLITGSCNTNILSFSRSLSAYLYHIALYLTFNTEVMPFPFSSWQTTQQFDLADSAEKSTD